MAFSIIRNAAAAMMLGASLAMPRLGQQERPAFTERAAPEYDGLGRKKQRPASAPDHGAKKQTKAWRDYARRVLLTHSMLPNGKRQKDPRDDKYLHSHARRMRAAAQARL